MLINGPMLEAKEGAAVLKDVDEYVFICFCQYLYTGDYDEIVNMAEPDTAASSTNAGLEMKGESATGKYADIEKDSFLPLLYLLRFVLFLPKGRNFKICLLNVLK